MNRDRLLADAKARALALAEGYRPPDPPAEIRLPGPTAKVALDLAVHAFARLGKATAHDRVVAGAWPRCSPAAMPTSPTRWARTICWRWSAARSCRLIRHPASIARIEHMLETGKPLRN